MPQIQDLRLAEHSGKFLEVSVKDSTFQIHREIFAWCRNRNLVSARALISAIKAFPTAFTTIMSEEEFNSFKGNVINALKGVLPDEVFVDRPPMKVAFGALKPPDKKSN